MLTCSRLASSGPTSNGENVYKANSQSKGNQPVFDDLYCEALLCCATRALNLRLHKKTDLEVLRKNKKGVSALGNIK